MTDDISITISRSLAGALCAEAGILINTFEDISGIPQGVWYDTNNHRWTWSLDEAATWAIQALAGQDS